MSRVHTVIGVVTSGRTAQAHALLCELERQIGRQSSIRIIVVENGTSTIHKPTHLGCASAWQHTPQASIPRARNMIYRQAQALKAQRLVFIDDDCWPSPTWMKVMSAYSFGATVVAATGACVSIPRKNRYAAISGILYDLWIQENTCHNGHLTVLDTKNVVFNLNLLHTMPLLFSENVTYGSDIKLAYTLRMRGMQLGYISKALVEHTERTSFVSFILHRARLSSVYQGVLGETQSFHSVSLVKKYTELVHRLEGTAVDTVLAVLSLTCAYAVAGALLLKQKSTNMLLK